MGDPIKENLAAVLHWKNDLRVDNIPLPPKPQPNGEFNFTAGDIL
jgi:hypothetical protein